MIRNAVELLSEKSSCAWMLLGKGPSFSNFLESRKDISKYLRFGLNDTAAIVECDVVHFMDVAALDRTQVLGSPNFILPWHPHVNHKPTEMTLMDLIEQRPHTQLAKTWFEGRLFSYNSSLSRNKVEGLPTVYVRHFSSVAAVSLLAMAGVREVGLVGIDGGNRYSKVFHTGPLGANGRTHFKSQFSFILPIKRKHRMKIYPMFPNEENSEWMK